MTLESHVLFRVWALVLPNRKVLRAGGTDRVKRLTTNLDFRVTLFFASTHCVVRAGRAIRTRRGAAPE